MIKILINNEEVVCNNNISIKEEMLSTSSTILKNCYPKSWEEDKNYTSRYYFPQDYSKCKIINDEPIDFEIVGETTQTGTPTPDSPKPIINKSGIIQETIGGLPYTFNLGDIELCKIGNYQDSIKKSTGKNLFDKNNYNVLNAYIDNNTITSGANHRTIWIECKPETTYTIQKINKGSNKRFRVATSTNTPQIGGTTMQDTGNLPNNDSITITTNSTAHYLLVWCYVTNDTEVTWQQIIDSIQIEQNNQATEYEPYGKVWYVENKNIKITLDSNTNFTTDTIPSGNPRRYITTYQGVIVTPPNNDTKGQGYSNVGIVTATNTALATARGIAIHPIGNLYIDGTTYSNLGNTPIDLIVPLKTPTYTEITSPTLLEQLNNVGQRLVFCGCIKNTGNISLNPREPHFVDLQVLDFKTLLSEGETLNYVITGKTIVEAINQVVNSISNYGFIVGNIEILNPDDIINAYSTLNKTAYDVFQYIADITQSRWTTRMIDENTIAIDFYDPTLMPTASPIQSTQTYYENNQIIDISFNYSTNDYRNKQIMTSDEVFANITQTETLIADGYTQNFMCQNKLGTIETITVNGVSKTFATKSEQALGITADFYYQPGEIQFSSANTISTGSVIIITYYAIVKGREIILNTDETSRIETQINRKGSISRYENRNDTTSSQELQKIGQTYIKYKGKAEINLKVKTRMDLFNVGQIVEYQAPLEELSTEYMVKSKEIDWYAAPDETFYIYELTSNFNYENAVNYFDNQRAKSQGNLDVGQTITRNIDIENKALIIFYDTEQEEIEPINPSSLDFALDGVLI